MKDMFESLPKPVRYLIFIVVLIAALSRKFGNGTIVVVVLDIVWLILSIAYSSPREAKLREQLEEANETIKGLRELCEKEKAINSALKARQADLEKMMKDLEGKVEALNKTAPAAAVKVSSEWVYEEVLMFRPDSLTSDPEIGDELYFAEEPTNEYDPRALCCVSVKSNEVYGYFYRKNKLREIIRRKLHDGIEISGEVTDIRDNSIVVEIRAEA